MSLLGPLFVSRVAFKASGTCTPARAANVQSRPLSFREWLMLSAILLHLIEEDECAVCSRGHDFGHAVVIKIRDGEMGTDS
jgi:hypothetical protein